MSAEESSSWNVNRVRSGLLNNPSSGQDARSLLQAFLKVKGHILVIRQLATGEQAKLLEIIDQVRDILGHPSATIPCGPDRSLR